MSKKRKDPIKISFVGQNNEHVTGSCILIETMKHKILLECGLFQGNNIKKDHEINSRKFKGFKPKDIDFIFINHAHIDHCGLLPRLYAEGCKAEIISVKDTNEFLNVMLKDSAYIMERDVVNLSRKSDIDFKPIYTDKDVNVCVKYISGHEFNKVYTIDDEISFEFIPAGHIIRSAQLRLWIKHGNTTKKILYTSDIGNVKVEKYFTEKFVPEEQCNLVIGECTYNSSERTIKEKDRQKDLEKIETVIDTICLERNGRVLIPSFSLDRTQNILKILYDIFGKIEDFNVPIILDSPLSSKLTDVYMNILNKDDKLKLQEVLSWKNLKIIKDSSESKLVVGDKGSKIIVSASGMMTAGRSRFYIKSILPDPNSAVLFIGFATPGSLAGKIKDGVKQKTITIDGKAYKNKCQIVDLKSFTCHMQYDDLLKYYSDINCEKIALVHSEFKGKVKFAEDLQKEISRKNKTSKVICVNSSTIVNM
jgi:metallo-beta-lactamase family protein